MSENIYKKARLEAAKKNPELKTIVKTYPQLFMTEERLQRIEQDKPGKRKSYPTPDEVNMMAKLYNAPELCDYYCTNHCPLGIDKQPLMYDNLGEIAANLMSSLHFLNNANDTIHRILKDSVISDGEKKEFDLILDTLHDIAFSANSLELWAKKNGYDE